MLTSNQLRQKYLDFFVARGHKIIPSAPLVPENDPSTLFTSSGMQPLIPYLLGEPHTSGRRLVNSQKCFRSQDIDEVGDNRHTTFFEMLGNWSLGDYFKIEQLSWFFEFLTNELKLPVEKLYVSVFEGTDTVEKDTVSAEVWKSLGIPDNHIFYYGVKKNWWSRSGVPDSMPPGEPGGPDSEVFFEFTNVLHDPKFGESCHPNCDCGRFLEIGNSVFMQFQKQINGSLKELPQKNVDFGGGFERILAAVQNTPDVFKTDLFLPIVKTIEDYSQVSYSDPKYQNSIRIIVDHIKSATMLITDGVAPSNKAQGYMLRRLIRRAALKMKKIQNQPIVELTKKICLAIGNIYNDIYLDSEKTLNTTVVLSDEVDQFDIALNRGTKEISKYSKLDGKIAFDLFQTYGFPWELTAEIAADLGQEIDPKEFESEFKKHQDLSRTASKGMFKGGLQDQSETVTKYHTATHLLHKALRITLGDHVQQKGSNITSERLRFDFSHSEKLTPEQIQLIEQEINLKISDNLPVTRIEMPKSDALAQGALAFFPEKYPEITSVYTIGDAVHWYSKELCGGPHVTSTGVIGKIKIIKEESAGAGIRRIYAQLATDSPLLN
jgi:alanyl-tRNA synthetase